MQEIAAFLVLPLDQCIKHVVRSDLIFEMPVGLLAGVVVVRPGPGIMVVGIIQTGAQATVGFIKRPLDVLVASLARLDDDRATDTVGGEQFGILLLGDKLRERSTTDRSQQVGQQLFVEPSRLIAQQDALGIAQRIETVRQKKVGRRVRVVDVDRPGGFADRQIRHSVVLVDRGQIRTAHGAVLVEQELGTIHTAIIVEAHGFLDVADGLVVTVFLLGLDG